MTYNGIEIDMLSLGDADSILVTHWVDGRYMRILVDGGNKGSTATVRQFLHERGISHLQHVVCTHPHDDHAAGLVELLSDTTLVVDRVWVHRPLLHVDSLAVEFALNQTHGLRRAAVIRESLATVNTLAAICERRGIPTSEPFAGDQIGPLTVVGPTEDYYSELVAQFADSGRIRASEVLVSSLPNQTLVEALLSAGPISTSSVLEANPQTEPENNSSVILALDKAFGLHLFTGDAGAQALTRAAQQYNLANCHWMQIPHHGSRRNLTETLIQHFQPDVAFVSAAGNVKHPRRAIVNAFGRVGTRVFSTHYPHGGHLWHHQGIVPDRIDYTSAYALWEAPN